MGYGAPTVPQAYGAQVYPERTPGVAPAMVPVHPMPGVNNVAATPGQVVDLALAGLAHGTRGLPPGIMQPGVMQVGMAQQDHMGVVQIGGMGMMPGVGMVCMSMMGTAAPLDPAQLPPYPEHLPRKAPTFSLIFGLAFTVFPLLMFVFLGGLFFAIGIFDMWGWSEWLMVLPFLSFPLIGISFLRGSIRERANQKTLVASGARCWGRVTRIEPGNSSRRSGALRWIQMKIFVEAFAVPNGAEHMGGFRSAPAAPVVNGQQVCIDWYISELQIAMLQPGAWCAFLLDPRKPNVVQLEGLRAMNGTVVPLQ
jgi:hypothetical protein